MVLGIVPAMRPVQHAENGVGRQHHGNVAAQFSIFHRLGDQLDDDLFEQSGLTHDLVSPDALFAGDLLHIFLDIDVHFGEVVAVGEHELFHDILQALARRPRGFFDYAYALLDVRPHAAADGLAEQFYLAAALIINGAPL